MQFGEKQREQALANWGPSSWFYQNLGQPAREIVGRAYGVIESSDSGRTSSQEYLTLALDLFAQKIGAEKSHVVHALLTGLVIGLQNAIIRGGGKYVSTDKMATAWEEAFREVNLGQ